jgi:hypothetical protein
MENRKQPAEAKLTSASLQTMRLWGSTHLRREEGQVFEIGAKAGGGCRTAGVVEGLEQPQRRKQRALAGCTGRREAGREGGTQAEGSNQAPWCGGRGARRVRQAVGRD